MHTLIHTYLENIQSLRFTRALRPCSKLAYVGVAIAYLLHRYRPLIIMNLNNGERSVNDGLIVVNSG